jgi:hypothetical protein
VTKYHAVKARLLHVVDDDVGRVPAEYLGTLHLDARFRRPAASVLVHAPVALVELGLHLLRRVRQLRLEHRHPLLAEITCSFAPSMRARPTPA